MTGSPDDTNKRCVLVLDDDEAIRRTVERILTLHGYEVLVAADASRALALLTSHPGPIHAVLCDLVLPGLGGREAANTLLARRPDMKILYMSGYSTHDSHRRDLESAGEAFLGKPFEVDTLVAAVEALLSG